MKLSIGIVGLPNVGKSTLFKALTKQEINIANYPFATIDPNVGIVNVPDERLDKLTKLSNSEKTIPAVVEFYDIAGLVKGANKGEGLGNKFLTHIRETSVIVQVVRCFESSDITHVENDIHPLRDVEIINSELILKDIGTAEKRLEKRERDAKTGDKDSVKDVEILKKVLDWLDKGRLLKNIEKEILNEKVVKEMNLLTAKEQFYLLNGMDEDVPKELTDKISSLGSDYLIVDLGEHDAVDELVWRAYKILGLISFFTTGKKETRAWTTFQGAKAHKAAGVIHSDFEERFIRADVIFWEKLLEAGGWREARAKGWIRSEGKEYIVQDGDVVEIKHG